MIRVACGYALGRCYHGGQRGLHVSRAPAVQVTFSFDSHKGIARPSFQRSRGDDVHVSSQTDKRRLLPSACPEVPYAASVEPLAMKTHSLEAPRDDVETPTIGRCDGWTSYQ